MFIRRALIAFFGAFLWLSPTTAWSQEVRVVAPASVDKDALASRLKQALSPLNRSGTVTVTVTVDETSEHLRVVFERGRGAPPIERSVSITGDQHAREDAAIWLAVNLVSDEATEVIDALAPKQAPKQDSKSAPQPTPVAPPHETTEREEPPPCVSRYSASPVVGAFFSPLAFPMKPVQAHAALGLLYADIAELRGGGLSVATRLRCDLRGGLVNAAGGVVEGNTTGALLSGIGHYVVGKTSGVSLAGLAAFHRDRVDGVVAGGIATITTAPVFGAQIGNINVAMAPLTGAEMGVLNIADDVRGAQVGLLNFGGATSAQFGMVNIAKDADAAFGLVSVSWARPVRLNAWTSTLTPLNVAILFDAKRVYSSLNFGRLIRDRFGNGEVIFGFELGIHILRSDDRGLVLDALASTDTNIGLGDGKPLDTIRTGLRAGYRMAPRFAPYLYGGAATIDENHASDELTHIKNRKTRPEFGGGIIF